MGTVATIICVAYGLSVGLVLKSAPDRERPGRARTAYVTIGGIVCAVIAVVFLLIPFVRGDGAA